MNHENNINLKISTDQFFELHALISRELDRTNDALDQISGTPFEDLRPALENTSMHLNQINENFTDISRDIVI